MIYLDDLVTATRGELRAAGARSCFPGFAHDSRQVAPGECFVAVRGPHADGHEFIEDAVRRGAGALVVEARQMPRCEAGEPGLLERLEDAGTAVVAVGDSREALRDYATYILERWKPLVVAVTGSTGKTTTKEAIADVLGRVRPTFRSWRNYNDLLGLPLALGRLEPAHRFAVVEMACDHPGEMQALCTIARPTVGVVTNVSATQLQYFGSVASLAAELTQLPRALPAAGFAVLNSDDPAVRAMGSDTEANLRFFGALSDTVDADDLRRTVRCTLAPMAASNATTLALTFPQAGTRYPDGGRAIFHHLHGDHWANAVLAALTVGEALGVELDVALDALVELRPLPGRLNWLAGAHHLIVLDDSHNAAPASMRAGLDALAAVGRAQPSGAARIAVLGDMLRLGDTEMDAHHQVGQQAFATATHLVTMGSRAEWIAQAALTAGMPAERVAVTRSHDDAARAVLGFAANPTDRTSAGIDHDARQWRPDAASVVLIKGSEDIRMERITSQLLAQPERAEELLDRQTPGWQRVVMMRPDRPTWLEVDLDAIARNTRLIKELVGPEVAVLVSLKADAYGHGALPVARTVLRNGASWLGVATVSEARPLRQAGITAPMLIFGYTAPWQAREAVHLDLSITVFSIEAAQALSRAACELQRTVRVHVKIDTGMGRLGLRAEDVRSIIAFFEELETLPGLVVEGMFTHLSSADSADPSYTQRQIARFARVLDGLERHNLRPAIVHAANSAATLAWPEMRYNLVRPGIAIYGLSPSEAVRLPFGFRPALAFRTQVVQVSELAAGEGISYGATYVTEGPTRVATLPVGYADGFRRGPTTWGEVLVRGQRAPLIGRVCMDQCMIDVTRIADVRVGDEVTLIGQQGDDELTAEAVAARLGTIHYEVVAELLARVPRVS